MARLDRVVAALGAITTLFSLAFLLPLLAALVYDPYDTTIGIVHLPLTAFVFAACALGTAATGYAMQRWAGRHDDLRDNEAYILVGIGWLWICLLAMVPFLLTGVLASPIDAFFEAMSALTTTGATVIGGSLDAVAPSVMLWRAFLQFLGGMGIVVLSVALLARLTQGGLQMLQAEAPGPSVTRIAPRLAQTARILWSVYLSMAAMLFLLLVAAMARLGMDAKTTIYEALLHTFTTISTGGFSNHDASIAHFGDWLIEAILVVFMLAAATNFALHYRFFKQQQTDLLKDPEWRLFLGIFAGSALVITLVLWNAGQPILGALRGAVFTVASLLTSTGFATVDFDAWPELGKLAILFLMVTGGTAGSTAGGLKVVRAMVLFQLLRTQFTRIRHPNAITHVRLGGRILEPGTVAATAGFFLSFLLIWALGSVILLAGDPAHFHDPIDAASASISALSNMGPGLGVVGPTHTYAALNPVSKVTLSLEMWIGRLEIFTALLLMVPEAWRH